MDIIVCYLRESKEKGVRLISGDFGLDVNPIQVRYQAALRPGNRRNLSTMGR
jgi:hypothetical protein